MTLGLIELPVWGYVAVALVLTHITIAGVTIYLHRHQAHRALDLHPLVSHFFRFWLWLTTGMETIQWVAVHRKHHAHVETDDDPHSPQVVGLRKVLLEGAELYRIEAKNEETLRKYGHGTPNDWLERNIYRRSRYGVALMMVLDLLLFGPIGLTIWAIQMLWIPLLAAGVINGLGHHSGYRRFETADSSTNIIPIGVLIGGEELHNNHHAFASSAKFSRQWWEFDAGWLYICLLSSVGLARVKKVAPKPVKVAGKALADADTLSAVLSHRFQVMADYAKTVVACVHEEELKKADAQSHGLLVRAKGLLIREESMLSAEAKERLNAALQCNRTLEIIYEYKQQLQAIWQERTASHERLLAALQEWCRKAEATGIGALQDFARSIPTYSMGSTPAKA